jgi:hypothetical protein
MRVRSTPFVAACAALLLALAAGAAAAPFRFVALGDTAYNGEADYVRYRRLIDAINARDPAFSIHVGDLWGANTCADASYAFIEPFFARYDHPLVYTPGDNEWTDCGRVAMGGYAPAERLDHIRERWFAEPASLGAEPMAVVRQADVDPAHGTFVENLRFERDGVLFVTVNVPGSNNNAGTADRARIDEFFARDAANVAWIDDSFRRAIADEAAAVVVALHAEMFRWQGNRFSPYANTIRALRTGADRFGRPVLLIHGDAHTFVIDRPLLEERGEGAPPLHANLVRLQVFGAPEIAAVAVGVDPSTPAVFSFAPLLLD